MRPLHESNDVSFFQAKINVPVSVTGFLIVIEGTSDTGRQLALADIGRVQYRKRGKLLVDLPAQVLASFDDVIGGHHYRVLPTAGATYVALYLPRSYILPQVETILPEDNATITIDFNSQFDTEMASAVTTVYGIEDVGAQAYDLVLHSEERDFNNTSGRQTISMDSVENIGAVYITDTEVDEEGDLDGTDSDFTRITGNVGDFEFDMTKIALIAKTNITSEVADAHGTYFTRLGEIFRADAPEISGKLSDNLTLHIEQNGATHPHVLVVGYAFNPDKLAETSVAVRDRRVFLFNQLGERQKTRTQRVVNRIAGPR